MKKKKSIKQFKHVLVEEWYEETRDGIYLCWMFEDGSRFTRLTAYKELPVIEFIATEQETNKQSEGGGW